MVAPILCYHKVLSFSKRYLRNILKLDNFFHTIELPLGDHSITTRFYFLMFIRFFCRIFICFAIISSAAFSGNIGKKSAIVIDYSAGKKVVFDDNSGARRHPASLTKVMTIYLLFDAMRQGKINFETKFKVSKFATTQMPSKLGLKVGEKITVLDIVKALIVKSANDVAVVAAEGLCGSVKNFCNLMNMKARQLGMNSTHFENPSGVPNKLQITTARDIATLGMAMFRDFPQHWHLFSLKSITYNGAKHGTHCKILHWYKGADGAKTGYICASGFNLWVTAQKYNKSGSSKRLFVVVMGGASGKSRDFYAAQLMDKYLKEYKICSSQQPDGMLKAKKKLLEQVSKAEMLEPVVQEEGEVALGDLLSSPDSKYFDELYEHDEDVVKIEEEIFIKPVKHKNKYKRKRR